MPLPRSVVALGSSLLLHGAALAALLGAAVWQGLPSTPVEIELVGTKVDEVKELPLGPPPPPGGAAPDEAAGAAPRPARRPRPKPAAGGTLAAAPDAGAGEADGGAARDGSVEAADAAPGGGRDGGRARPRDLRAYGPEGSRVTALLRLDRLRGAPDAPATIAAVDALLQLLPDRRRLLDGTGLDLYRDFDALLIATPNPLDDAVTFLAARHRLDDAAIKAALERGAAAAGRPITWRADLARPVGIRARPGAAPGGRPERDDRLLVLPAPGLAVMAPPAYAKLLVPGAAGDAGAPDRPSPSAGGWRDLVARIDAEGGAIPDDAVLMMSAANLFRAPRVAPGTRGQVDDDAPAPPPRGPFGLPLPPELTLVAGVAPAHFAELTAAFATEEPARTWEARWPALKQEALGNPLLLLGGFTSTIAAIDVRREGTQVVIRLETTGAELRRLLLTVASLVRGGGF